MAKDKHELASLLARVIGGGSVLAVDASAFSGQLSASAVEEVAAPEAGAIAFPPGEYDAALIGGLGAATPLAIARAAAEHLRAAAVIVFALPTPSGLKRLFRKKARPVPLEELCESLLIAGFTGIEARELDRGTTVVWGRLAAD